MLDSTRSPFNPIADALLANVTTVEFSNADRIEFTDTGFQLKTSLGPNESSGNYIYMAFKGSYSDHVSPLNETGSIDSRVKANPSKGFSIVSYEGTGVNATVGHGLSSAPEMIIVKDRNRATEWPVMAQAANSGNGHLGYLRLNGTYAWGTTSILWNDTAPTSSVFSIGTYDYVNFNNSNYIAYCFHSVAGYSKIGSYTGTGSSGNVVTTGFKPAFVMIKNTSASASWNIIDSTRSPVSTTGNGQFQDRLFPDLANAESTDADVIKFTDTGFVINIASSSQFNNSGNTYIYMAFADTADAVFNFDASGNKNNWLPNNINSNADSESTYDLMKDTPSLVDENAGNFCTWSALGNPLSAYTITLSEGNLKASYYVPTNNARITGTIAVSSGKWYFEFQATAGSPMIGFAKTDGSAAYVYDGNAALKRIYAPINGGQTSASYGATWDTTNTIGVALDLDAGTLVFYKDNVSQGTAYTGLSGTFTPTTGYQGGTTVTGLANFGQRPFTYTPPTGFLKLNTFNLPDSTIKDGSDYFNTVLYNGTGSTQAVTGTDFQPDLVWLKSRSNSANHGLHDVLRVIGGAEEIIKSNSTDAGNTGGAYLSSFDSNGFTVNTNTSGNASGQTYVAWNWLANGTGVSNTDGSINSTVSVNTTAGFSIVTYTDSGSAATVGHGLGVKPDLIIQKPRNATAAWYVFVEFIDGSHDYLNLNSTLSKQNSGIAAPTSSVFSALQIPADTVAYCFNSVEGYSAFGKYTGNGSTNGPFVYTGFRPAWVMIKRTDSATGGLWQIQDTARTPFNWTCNALFADSAGAENTSELPSTYGRDYLSNGFKIRASHSTHNTNGGTYMYMAFAENPFKNALAR
jgi:hypothetical protein